MEQQGQQEREAGESGKEQKQVAGLGDASGLYCNLSKYLVALNFGISVEKTLLRSEGC